MSTQSHWLDFSVLIVSLSSCSPLCSFLSTPEGTAVFTPTWGCTVGKRTIFACTTSKQLGSKPERLYILVDGALWTGWMQVMNAVDCESALTQWGMLLVRWLMKTVGIMRSQGFDWTASLWRSCLNSLWTWRGVYFSWSQVILTCLFCWQKNITQHYLSHDLQLLHLDTREQRLEMRWFSNTTYTVLNRICLPLQSNFKNKQLVL